ncbi:hypothetical protein [Legionella jordanis]|uniref:Type I secretion system LssZ n=1 Tax=Legionella jordanis TaxID=456 RepID=A0A0W0VAU8_9GAMM|nr:hypothetical protein [Legionella jordanis]KTD17216.1 type I secretion system LssZ [Legionella jordanis]RMX03334.1 type I secretion system protein LssZ [Legionella jordanis]RMX15813.1 type I secretion system protein LssZ [Legionella jordanis]VEH12586.1 type I secretion system LssZ [Legionella jordanis]HAT8713340.1 type I secretion system protein LssZ [Legionella jordanis]
MINIADLIHIILPFLALIVLVLGLKFKRSNYILIALWVSLITLLLAYRASGGEILGSYFNYLHASTYSLNLIILLVSFLYLLLTAVARINHYLIRSVSSLVSAALTIGVVFLLINLWVNAIFIEHRLAGTPILQVATFNKPPYCDYKYVFYKISDNNKVKFMCPNHYGLLPSIGELNAAPTFVIKQLPTEVRARFQQPT